MARDDSPASSTYGGRKQHGEQHGTRQQHGGHSSTAANTR